MYQHSVDESIELFDLYLKHQPVRQPEPKPEPVAEAAEKVDEELKQPSASLKHENQVAQCSIHAQPESSEDRETL